MASKVLIFGMLISLISIGLVFVSLITNKWLVIENKDVGIFGICEYFNVSDLSPLLYLINTNNSFDLNNTNEKNDSNYINNFSNIKLGPNLNYYFYFNNDI